MIGDSGSQLSFIRMVANADFVVQAVVAALVLCSVICWGIIFEKIARMRSLSHAIGRVEAFAQSPDREPLAADSLLSVLLEGIRDELNAEDPEKDTRARVEAALRAAFMKELRKNEAGLPFLATIASAAPFVGLFGTVWGIMHSFTAIAEAQDTSLAAVAPGIAESLLATAVGLGAAIPAVIGYNQFRATLSRCGHRLAFATAAIARKTVRSGFAGRGDL